MIAALVALSILGAAPATSDPGYRFARALALAGPRPAGSAAEERAHARVEARFRAAGLRVGDVWLIATGAEERIYTGRPDHLGALAAVARVRRFGRARDLRFALSLDEVGRGRTMHLRSPVAAPRAGVERAILAAARTTGLRVRWLRDSGTGNSDHREFALAGLPAAKLGVPDEPCRHTACDTVARLQAGTFPRVRKLIEQLLAATRA
jgi:hypothetical protein